MEFLKTPTRNLFFTGKGGVGKTSIACATAIHLADSGRQVLLVSTDPASNLDEVLGFAVGTQPEALAAVPGLSAMNLDPEQAAAEYRERVVGPYRQVLPEAAVRSMEEQLSGSCTVEIAAFDEFTRLLADPAFADRYDHVVFDTAPTGHTLRLLSLPAAWSDFIDTNTTGTSCLGPLAGLETQQHLYQQTVQSLCDPVATTLVLVTRAEPSALTEADRTSRELAALGVQNQQLVINAIYQASDKNDSYALAMQQRVHTALHAIPEQLAGLPRTEVPLAARSVVGCERLRRFFQSPEPPDDDAEVSCSPLAVPGVSNLESVIESLAEAGRGVIMTMGKGGVGKTTVAAAIACALADKGLNVYLTTTDPAAHLEAAVAQHAIENLSINRIDPVAETERYAQEVMETAGSQLDAQGRALLEEDLRSPCTEEIAVFRAFAQAVEKGEDQVVVLDTAPTGHTILLLDAASSYHREVTRQASQMPESVQRLLPRLRDPECTRVLIVTLPEATPVHEAARLQSDLQRAEIEPYAWVINQSLLGLPLTDPVLRQRQQTELPFIREVMELSGDRAAIIPWQLEPLTGRDSLLAIAGGS